MITLVNGARCVAIAVTLGLVGCAQEDAPAATLSDAGKVPVTEDTFSCIRDMTLVREFYVDNLLGDRAATVAVAQSEVGGVYPPGSIVQLIPTEAMVKHGEGFNPETNDWEFFELDVDGGGSSIRVRGFSEVVNQFGGNCLECHARAEPQWDMICETTHGCDPIPLSRNMFRAIQNTDPRCEEIELPPEQVQALEVLTQLQAAASETPREE